MLIQDFRFALRSLRRDPVYTLAAVVTLALAIGAAAAVYAVIDATLLRPLPYRSPADLVSIGVYATAPGGAASPFGPSQIELVRWRAATRSFESRAGVEPRVVALTGNGEAEAVKAAAVPNELFAMLGVEPVRGRAFTAREEESGQAVVLVSDALWRRRLKAADTLDGVVVEIDGRPYDVVGVMPNRFEPTGVAADVWLPLHPVDDFARGNARVMNGIARLRPGVSTAQAQRELEPINVEIARQYPAAYRDVRPRVTPLRDQLYGNQKPALVTLAAAVALLLTLAAVNVGNLTLGHLARRRDEIGVRAMLGGSRWRIVRLQLVETALLAASGGAVGFWMVGGVLPPLLRVYAAADQTPIDARVDWRVAAFGFALTAAVAVVCGVLPAWRSHAAALSGGAVAGRATGGPRERHVAATLMTLQVGLAVALLCAAAAFATSLQRVLAAHPGFSPDHVLVAQMLPAPARYSDVVSRARFVDRIVTRIQALPGVVSVGTSQTTFLPNQSMQTNVFLEGQPQDVEHTYPANMRHVMPGFFPTLHVPIIEGRAIDGRDAAGAPMVAVVSAAFAKAHWPGTNAVGRRLRRTGPTAQWLTIVGIASDIMDVGLGVQAGPTLYVPYQQQNTMTARVTLLVRTTLDPQLVAGQVQRAVWAEDPLQPVDAVAPLVDLLAGSTGDRRFQTVVLAAFAGVGLTLALVGVYGVAAAAVKSRAREVGVRLALGATPASIVGDAVARASTRVAVGAAAGLLVFLGAGRALRQLLYETSVWDPFVIAIAVLPLAIAALTITYRQARRLAATSPVIALRGTE